MQEASQRHNELKAAGYNALDPLLTAEGEEAALKLGDELTEVLRGAGSAGGHDRLLITSPLRRAMQTAFLILCIRPTPWQRTDTVPERPWPLFRQVLTYLMHVYIEWLKQKNLSRQP